MKEETESSLAQYSTVLLNVAVDRVRRNWSLLISTGVAEVVPSFRSDDIGHEGVGEDDARERPPCSAQPDPPRAADAAVDEGEAGVLVAGCSPMRRHRSIYRLQSRRHRARYRYHLAALRTKHMALR